MYSLEWGWILNASPHTGQPKTQITLPANPAYQLAYDADHGLTNIRMSDRIIAARGRQEYLFPQGGKREAVGRILVTALVEYDVRAISAEQCPREGYASALPFLRVWASKHDPAAAWVEDLYRLTDGHSAALNGGMAQLEWIQSLQERDPARYKGIAVVFRKVDL